MPSPKKDPLNPAENERLAARLASLSPAQRDLLKKRLAARAGSAAENPPTAPSPPEVATESQSESIAVIGMGCRFPGADSLGEFWQLIQQQRQAVGPIPDDRWEKSQFFDPTGRAPGKMSVDTIGAVNHVDEFDPQFFGIAPREASRMDPQQRLLLEVTWETLENAGVPAESISGTDTGVFIGIGGTDYSKVPARYSNYFEHLDAHIGTGNALSIAAGRISYLFDLHGPSFIVDTACSSALVAVHSACTSLLRGECSTAIAGGVNLILSPETTIAFSKARMLSPDGHCRPFDQAANGYVRGEGCGIVLLKRLSDARKQGDNIIGILRGSAVNQDGRTSGITAPSAIAQQRVIHAAMKSAGVSQDDVTYIEAHGTGTPLGDPIELMALNESFQNRSASLPPIRIGSVKGNIGHTETASGIAGLLKVLLMFAHGRIPAQANFEELNSAAKIEPGRLCVAQSEEDWAPASGRMIAGVSSFGFGGTNAHVIAESATPVIDSADQGIQATGERVPASFCLPISTRDPNAMGPLADRYRAALDQTDAAAARDLCYTAALHRSALPIRAAVLAGSVAELEVALQHLAAGNPHADVVSGRLPVGRRARVAMLFTGQGSQYAGMAARLQQKLPVFKQALDECARVLDEVLEIPLRQVLASEDASWSIDHTSLAQPAICAVQCALADSFKAFGIRPDVVAGHSIGEIAALYAAGALGRREALMLAAYRGQVMGSMPEGGTMAAILEESATVQNWIDQRNSDVVIAAMNGPGSTVVAGTESSVTELIEFAESQEVATRRLAVSHAFHSPLMRDVVEPLKERLRDFLTSVNVPASVKFVSSVTGQEYREPIDVDYWLEHLLRPVRFTDVIARLSEMNLDLAIEVGASPQICGMIRRASTPDGEPVSLRTMATLDPKKDDERGWAKAIATAWCVGLPVDWRPAYANVPAHRVEAPTYPFQRERYWYDPPRIGNHGASGSLVHPLLGVRQRLAAGGTVYQVALRDDDPSYLADHVVGGSVTVPAAAWIEAMRAAAEDVMAESHFELQDIEIQRALFLPERKPVSVQTHVESIRAGRCRIRIDTRLDSDDGEWQTCASSTAVIVQAGPIDGEVSSPQTSPAVMDGDEFYEAIAGTDLAYGELFQVLDQIESDGVVAAATLRPAKPLSSEIDQYPLHPTLVDGALQLIAAVFPMQNGQDTPTYLPVGVQRLVFLDSIDQGVTGARVRRVRPSDLGSDAGEIVADVELTGDDGVVLARLEGVCLKRLQRDQAQGQVDPAAWIHRVDWQVQPSVSSEETPLRAPFAHRHFGSCQLQTLIPPPVDTTEGGREHWIWTAPSSSDPDATFQAASSLLATVQDAVGQSPVPMLSVVTQLAHRLGDESTVDPVATAVTGFARVVQNEHPELELRILDVDQFDGETAELISDWLQRDEDEWEQAIRRGKFYHPRLVASPRLYSADDDDAEIGLPRSGSYRIRLDGTNRLDGLWVERMPPPGIGPGALALEIDAVGLNFSDVLKSMGLYPGIEDEVVPMGIEVCGRVTAIGEGVQGMEIGSRVMGVVPYGFSSHDVTKDYLLVPVPEGISNEEAASIPIAFLTAHHALLHVGRLQEGESVLIHAGAGGVGLAAIEIAHSVGATVYATAGNPTKRRLLAQLGVDPERIFSSRDLESIDAIRQHTGGRGVDVVLNSLPGEWIDASIALLASHGRFLEIGKTDIYQNRAIGLLPFQDNLSYCAIDLDRIFRERPAQVRRLFAEVHQRFCDGTYQPTPLTSFRLQELPSAMRFMAARRNIGKVVISPPKGSPDRVAGDGVHLITGGSGAIAMAVARRLIQRGATAVALVGRSEASEAVRELIQWADDQGATCRYHVADCADSVSMRKTVQAISDDGGRIVSVIHAAGVLEDGLVCQMTGDSLRRVLEPKVAGARVLDEVTKDQPIKSFILLGSVAAMFGSPGQSNYAAANAYLEGFAAERHCRSLPATVVHWGPWASAGMADDPTRLKNLAARGLQPLRVQAAVDLLIDGAGGGDAVIVDADFNRMLGGAPANGLPSLLRDMQLHDEQSSNLVASAKDAVLLAELQPLDHQQAREKLQSYFAQQLGRIMSMDAASIDGAQPLGSLGLDSLMAIELKNTIEAKLDISLPIARFMDEPTLESLAEAAADILSPEAVAE